MIKDYNKVSLYKHRITVSILFVLIFAVYSNTFTASWHLDDVPNITENKKLHLKTFSVKALGKTFFAHPSDAEKLYRPLSCFSFALNWYYGQKKVAGYHLINISIHCITSFFLFLTIFNILRVKTINIQYQGKEYFIALFSSLLWTLNPIQTQAVTYIVQRMASMAAMFYIIGLYCYVKARQDNLSAKRFLYFGGCFLSFLFALGSKENAAIFPFSVLLIEFIFLHKPNITKTAKWKYINISFIATFLTFIAACFFLNNNLFSFIESYSIRSFTLAERVLTESRIILYYLTQIFYPVPQRLSIEHDIVISTSFFDPWTTLFSIFFILILVLLSFYLIRKRPLLSFSILFFLLNHIIESTVLPLELFFEHRNYLPSMFLFMPITAGFIELINYYRLQNKKMAVVISSFIILLVAGFGTGTYIRNMAWASEITLWTDALKKAPDNARPMYTFAKHYYYKRGEYDKAYEFFKKALHSKASSPAISKAISLDGMASVALIKQNYDEVVKLCYDALEIYPDFYASKTLIIRTLITTRKWERALKAVEDFCNNRKHHEDYLYFKGLILLGLERAKAAVSLFNELLKDNQGNRRLILNLGVALSRAEYFDHAETYLLKAVQMNSNDINPYLFLLENSLKRKDKSKIERNLAILIKKFKPQKIRAAFKNKFQNSLAPIISYNSLESVIYKRLGTN